MSGDHNQYQKDKSYLDGMDRYKQVRELVKDPSLKIKDIVELTGYDKGHVSRLRKASQQFECPRCGHCCQADQLTQQQEPVAWISERENLLSWDKFYDHMKPLYTSPPKREWVRLTEKEVKAIANKRNDYGLPMTGRMWVFVANLTDKLKEKNHG